MDGGSSDACGVASLAIDVTSFDCAKLGPNAVKLTVVETRNNVAVVEGEKGDVVLVHVGDRIGTEGVLGFVNKPYRPQDLTGAVRAALDRGKVGPRPEPERRDPDNWVI